MKTLLNKKIFPMLRESRLRWKECDGTRRAASLAFYTAFSLGPLLLVAIGIASLVLGREAARGEIYNLMQGLAGSSMIRAIQKVVQATTKPSHDVWRGVMAFVLVVYGASRVFSELKNTLNLMWKVERAAPGGVWPWIRGRLLSMVMVLGICLLPLISIAVDAGIGAAEPAANAVRWVVDILSAFVLTAVLLAMLYKYLPDRFVAWKDVWAGSIVTALFFTLGKSALELIISVSAGYGAPGALALILIWVYYAVLIFSWGRHSRLFTPSAMAPAAPRASD